MLLNEQMQIEGYVLEVGHIERCGRCSANDEARFIFIHRAHTGAAVRVKCRKGGAFIRIGENQMQTDSIQRPPT